MGKRKIDLKYIAAAGLIVSVLALIVGCGGGGGGTSSTSGSNSGSNGSGLTSYQVTAVLQSNQSQMVDLDTLFVGDQVQLEVTARNSSGTLVTVPASGWSITAPSNVATVAPGGALSAVGPSGSSSYTVSATAGGKTYTSQLGVVVPQDVITGNVQDSSGQAVEYAAVMFYNSSGTLLSTTYSTREGNFRGSVPSTASKFTINTTPGDPGNVYYYLQFSFGNFEYLDGPSCLAPLGVTPSASAPTPLANPIVPDLKSAGPPPPPTGCIGD